MRKPLIVISILALATLTGCSNLMVPRTVIRIPMPSGKVATYSAPKDASVDELSVIIHTDGTIEVKAVKLKTVMNPAVITTSSEAFNSAISAAADAGAKIAAAAKGMTNAPAK